MAQIVTSQKIGFEISISGHDDGTLEAVYITVRDGKAATTEEVIEDTLLADYDSRGRLVGIEVLAPVKITRLTRLVEAERRAGFRSFVTQRAPGDLILA